MGPIAPVESEGALPFATSPCWLTLTATVDAAEDGARTPGTSAGGRWVDAGGGPFLGGVSMAADVATPGPWLATARTCMSGWRAAVGGEEFAIAFTGGVTNATTTAAAVTALRHENLGPDRGRNTQATVARFRVIRPLRDAVSRPAASVAL